MVYTPKLVSQNKSYLVNNVNSSSSYQSNEGFNSSNQWLRRRLEQSQEISFASEEDQSSPLLMRGKNRARSTSFQPFNILSPVYEQVTSSASTSTSPTTPTAPQFQGLFGEHSRTPLQSIQSQPRSDINTTTGPTIRTFQNTFQQDTSRPTSVAPMSQNVILNQSQSRAYVPITQSGVTPINSPMYTSPAGVSDSTFNVLNSRFERQQIPIYSSGTNLIGRDISNVNARIAESPLIQSTPAPKPRHQQTPPRKVEKVPYLARLLMIEQELPKNEYEVEKSNSIKTLFFNFCLGIFIIFLTSTKQYRRFENYYTSVVGYLMFCIPAFYILKVFYTNVQWARKKKQIDQLREKLVKELEQNSSYDTSSFTISPSGRSQIQSTPRPSRSTTTPLTTVQNTVVSSIPSQSTILPSIPSTSISTSTSTSVMGPPYTGGSTSTSTIVPSTSSASSFINAWGSPSGVPFPQRIPPTTKYRQAPYVTPSRIDEKLITIGGISARLPPEPKPSDRET
ncbi:hypothetical protein RhiirA5_411775 [Rhizophagus irregularis]|uniref:Uncharacterized protein n=4 Tax=Rhizophagus irregularis TaxID=588596 RepID=U9T098_RHIID|nr:hypothetical protein GLOIN_2v1771513 [Rhizophagus irregularis DAOM 181602=DAOM 197198]PKC12495.1 hypothetical protein RhiirA5_411775 [Rhizophagus irregularis]POG74300.1 hypothetical protein GLOIN_2v1771513 [Rhizophagus irregularis DAOM 181602=DAOM 197198]UZO04093.1 hypothetical protein OCT59_024492 [Rhizophagus irregularis]CAB4488282.1 unnamed protein product [Rhizophagus irregularis]CAB5200692.1 unnamed protein product [Rhizophagus irregularis]|eukprot:XP_025181166.1 hypothetical protein GLOIN_2v1771513 [Rhizophagus irregularis DAOM 181602=DAOM 197198]